MLLKTATRLLAGVVAQVSLVSAECWRDTACDGPTQPAFTGPWEANAFAPESRTLSPKYILDVNRAKVDNFPSQYYSGFIGNGSLLIFDFGLEVGGVLTIEYTATGTGPGQLGIAFSESSNFTGYISDESNGGSGPDGALTADLVFDGTSNLHKYVVPDKLARGGFRYVSLFTLTEDPSIEVQIKKMSVELSFHPNWPNLRAYGGYFHSSDDLLNKIWYANAYTLQTNYMATNTARVYPCLNTGWDNSADLGTNGVGLGAGNKRDRAVWAGDFGMSLRSGAIGLGDMGTLQRTLDLLFNVQRDTGETPFAAPPINFFGSDTYHMSTLIAVHDYILHSGDLEWLTSIWNKYKLGMKFVTDKIDSTGLIDITGANNWGRTAISSGRTTDGNALLYASLTTGAQLATWMNDAIGDSWSTLATTLKDAVVQNNWDAATGAFWNSDTDKSIHSQDGNSMAVFYGATDQTHFDSISQYLTTQWTPIGAECAELPGNIVTYIESFEIKAHMIAGQAKRGLDLIRTSWGWNLNHPNGTQSTFVEGYNVEGSWRYRDDNYSKLGSYTAHALGWATGPIDALNSYIVGLRSTGPGGKEWVLHPQIGDLEYAEGGFTLPSGKFSAAWTLSGNSLEVKVDVPTSTSGKFTAPAINGNTAIAIEVDGSAVTLSSSSSFDLDGGKHDIFISY